MSTNKQHGWVGVVLDGALAHYDRRRGVEHIGDPIPAMVELVKSYQENGIEVRIVTDRVAGELKLDNESSTEDIKRADKIRMAITNWVAAVFDKHVDVTCVHDADMIALYDARCIQVEMNTGVGLVAYYKDAADMMNTQLEDIRKALGLARQSEIMAEIGRLVS